MRRSCLSFLRWEIEQRHDWEPRTQWNHSEVEIGPMRRSRRRDRQRRSEPIFSPPSPQANDIVNEEISRLIQRFWDSQLQLPLHWRVCPSFDSSLQVLTRMKQPINSVPTERLFNTRQGTVDSVLSDDPQRTIPDSQGYMPSISTPSWMQAATPTHLCENRAIPPILETSGPFESVFFQTTVFSTSGDRRIHQNDIERHVSLLKLVNKTLDHTSIRQIWDLLVVMEPSAFPWSFQTKDLLEYREKQRHAGNIAINDSSRNLDIRSNEAISHLLFVYNPLGETIESEQTYRSFMGRILANILSTDALQAQW
jgi:hypothetical protein